MKSPSNNLDVKKACADHLKTEQHKTAVLNQVRRDGIDSLRPSTVKQQIATMFQVSEKALNIRILKIYDMPLKMHAVIVPLKTKFRSLHQ